MIENQAFIFMVFIINGILIGLLFDFFRIMRRTFKTNNIITYIEDFIFWILTGIILLYSIFTFNNGEIRIYMFLGVLLGITLYMLSISSYVIKINVKIINFIKMIIAKIIEIILYPIKLLLKILKSIFYKPVAFIIINVRKIIKKYTTKLLINNNFKPKNSKKVKIKEG